MQARDTPEHTGDEEQDSDKEKARSHTPQTPALQSSQFQTQHSSAPFGAPACIVSPPPAWRFQTQPGLPFSSMFSPNTR